MWIVDFAIKKTKKIECPKCQGRGWWVPFVFLREGCPDCAGSGEIDEPLPVNDIKDNATGVPTLIDPLDDVTDKLTFLLDMYDDDKQ